MQRQNNYILAVDQSTQGTKALLLDRDGGLVGRADKPHRQIVDEKGWVEHDLSEIYANTIASVKSLLEQEPGRKACLAALGISNQRETAAAWDKRTGEPVCHAIVWQCARGEEICRKLEAEGKAALVKERTGLNLSPYFTAAKLAWILQSVPGARELAEEGNLCCGTIDSWLVYKLTQGTVFAADYSNASRTQLFNVSTLTWDEEVCALFGIPIACLPRVTDSDACYGETDFDGLLPEKIKIHGVLGDSHGALFGQGCHRKGMAKATYGTGSSIMMNIGGSPIFSKRGLVTSIGWRAGGQTEYVLEGNINYTGAVVTWLQADLKLIDTAGDTEKLALESNPTDRTYLVPAFTGLGAPYWNSEVTGIITGITRTTGRAEVVRAGLDCIAYQIGDIVSLMDEEAGASIKELRTDGGPTKNGYLMQFQSDVLNIPVDVAAAEELSGIGAGYMAGIACGFYEKDQLFASRRSATYRPKMEEGLRNEKIAGWKHAVKQTLS